VKNPGVQKKLVLTFTVHITSYELKTPTKDNIINSVVQKKEGKKYSDFMKLSEVE
jgi:hypothetical protein